MSLEFRCPFCGHPMELGVCDTGCHRFFKCPGCELLVQMPVAVFYAWSEVVQARSVVEGAR